MDRFDTGAGDYNRDYSLQMAPAGTFSGSSLGDYLTKKEIGQGTVTAAPVALKRAPSAPKKSFFFFRWPSFLSFRSRGEQATSQATGQSGQAKKKETYTSAEKAELRVMIHENYRGDEAVLKRFDQLKPQGIFFGNYAYKGLHQFLDAPKQREALQYMVREKMSELDAEASINKESPDYKNANKAASDMKEFLNQGDLASAHRAALAFRGFARSAMNVADSASGKKLNSMISAEIPVGPFLDPSYKRSQTELRRLLDSSKQSIEKLQGYRMRSPSKKEIGEVEQMIQEGVKRLQFLSKPIFNHQKKVTGADQMNIAPKINEALYFLSPHSFRSIPDLQSALGHLEEAARLYDQLPNK